MELNKRTEGGIYDPCGQKGEFNIMESKNGEKNTSIYTGTKDRNENDICQRISCCEEKQEIPSQTKAGDNKPETFIYEFGGDFWAPNELGEDGKWHDAGNNYIIEVPLPIQYASIEEAKASNVSLQFRKYKGHIALIIWSGWKQGNDKDGKWFERVDAEILDIIYWEDWTKYKLAKEKPECQEKLCSDISTDYIPDATSWDGLFHVENLPDNWFCTVEGLYYCIYRQTV